MFYDRFSEGDTCIHNVDCLTHGLRPCPRHADWEGFAGRCPALDVDEAPAGARFGFGLSFGSVRSSVHVRGMFATCCAFPHISWIPCGRNLILLEKQCIKMWAKADCSILWEPIPSRTLSNARIKYVHMMIYAIELYYVIWYDVVMWLCMLL